MKATKSKKKTAFKRINIPFHKELYEKLTKIAEHENRSVTSQIIEILERETGLKSKKKDEIK